MSNVDMIAEVLLEYGHAFRGDWSSSTIDGRTVRDEMETLSHALTTGEEVSIDVWRERLGICLEGLGHWQMHCEFADDDEDRTRCVREY